MNPLLLPTLNYTLCLILFDILTLYVMINVELLNMR